MNTTSSWTSAFPPDAHLKPTTRYKAEDEAEAAPAPAPTPTSESNVYSPVPTPIPVTPTPRNVHATPTPGPVGGSSWENTTHPFQGENEGTLPEPQVTMGLEEMGSKPSLSTYVDRSMFNQESIAQFVAQHRPTLYILTPCFGSVCYVNYTLSLLKTIELCQHHRIRVKVEFCRNDSLVSRARNNLVARAVHDAEMTHILFIDNDLAWDPMDVIKLIMSNTSVVGGIYPTKRYHWNRLLDDPLNPYNSNPVQQMVLQKTKSQLKDLISDEMMVRCNLVSYNVNYLSNQFQIENNLAPVRHVATGFMMIQRATIETMTQRMPELKYVDDVQFLRPEENAFAYALFDCGVEDGHYFSEDWMFCHRWTKLGGTIHANIAVNLTHTEIEDYHGCYLASVVDNF